MQRIIIKYLEGRASEYEQAKLLNWMRKKENRKVFKNCQSEWVQDMPHEYFPSDGEESWHKLNSVLVHKNYDSWQKSIKMEWFSRIAAIFFFVISIGSLVWYYTHQSRPIPETFTTVIAENGQISKVHLPDGSYVWLNSGSTISYDNFFSTKNRDLVLTGEAYFNVSKNEILPFVVDCNGLKVRALGTRFNVNAYDVGKLVQIVLEDGAVELINAQTQIPFYCMEPGDRVEINLETSLYTAGIVNTLRYTSWKDGIINIYDLSIDEVVKQLEKRYNQQFKLTSEVKDLRYTFTIENETLEDILRLMKRITPIKIDQNEGVITIDLDAKKQ